MPPLVAVVKLMPSNDVFMPADVPVVVLAFHEMLDEPSRSSTRFNGKAGSGYCVKRTLSNETVPLAVLPKSAKPPLAISVVRTALVGIVRDNVSESTALDGIVRPLFVLLRTALPGIIRDNPRLCRTADVGIVRLPEFVRTADVGIVRLLVSPTTPLVGIVRVRPKLLRTAVSGIVRGKPRLLRAPDDGIVRASPKLCNTADVGTVRDTVVADGVKVEVVTSISEATPMVAEFEIKLVGLSPPAFALLSNHHKST